MQKTIKKIAICAVLVALGVVFSRVLSIPLNLGGAYALNLGFGMLPILLICVLFGPLYGCLGALCWDVAGAMIFPAGGFNPLFSISAAIFGALAGLVFIKNAPVTPLRVYIALIASQLVYSVWLNTLLIWWLYSVPFMTLLIPRLIETAIMIPINAGLVLLIIDVVKRTKLLPERFTYEDEEDEESVPPQSEQSASDDEEE